MSVALAQICPSWCALLWACCVWRRQLPVGTLLLIPVGYGVQGSSQGGARTYTQTERETGPGMEIAWGCSLLGLGCVSAAGAVAHF